MCHYEKVTVPPTPAVITKYLSLPLVCSPPVVNPEVLAVKALEYLKKITPEPPAPETLLLDDPVPPEPVFDDALLPFVVPCCPALPPTALVTLEPVSDDA